MILKLFFLSCLLFSFNVLGRECKNGKNCVTDHDELSLDQSDEKKKVKLSIKKALKENSRDVSKKEESLSEAISSSNKLQKKIYRDLAKANEVKEEKKVTDKKILMFDDLEVEVSERTIETI